MTPVIPRHLQHPPEADAPRRVHTGTMISSHSQQRPSFPTEAPDIMPADTSTMCPGCAGDGFIHNAPCGVKGHGPGQHLQYTAGTCSVHLWPVQTLDDL